MKGFELVVMVDNKVSTQYGTKFNYQHLKAEINIAQEIHITTMHNRKGKFLGLQPHSVLSITLPGFSIYTVKYS